MRLADADTLHSLALYVLPAFVAWCGFGTGAAIVATFLVAIAGIVARLASLSMTADEGAVELHTITYSHYVEKVRWCLDRTGIEYREVPSVGILGLLLTARTVPLLVLPASRTAIGDSPKILRFLWGNWSSRLAPERVRFLEPTAEAIALERHFDTQLGVNIRVWSYWHLLRQKDLTLMMWGVNEPTIPGWQKAVLPITYPLLVVMLRRMLGASDERAAAGLEATRRVFAEVDGILADGRRYLLGGDEPTYVDFTFASLAALGVFPDGYGGNAVSVRRAPLELMAPAWRAEIEALRNTEAGRFAARLYAEERFRKAGAKVGDGYDFRGKSYPSPTS